jgi:hypothetical protein
VELAMIFIGLIDLPALEAAPLPALSRGGLHNLCAHAADGHELSGREFVSAARYTSDQTTGEADHGSRHTEDAGARGVLSQDRR